MHYYHIFLKCKIIKFKVNPQLYYNKSVYIRKEYGITAFFFFFFAVLIEYYP